jgi:putative ABC transport system substrate-binding protein
LGWTDGRNVRIDIPVACGQCGAPSHIRGRIGSTCAGCHSRLCQRECVAALQQASHSAPIVFANVIDPVGAGFVASLPQRVHSHRTDIEPLSTTDQRPTDVRP